MHLNNAGVAVQYKNKPNLRLINFGTAGLSQSNTVRLKTYTLLALRHYTLACVQTEEVFWFQRRIALYCTWNELDNFFVFEVALLRFES